MKIPLIIDTDPGVDDAFAIYLALKSPAFQLLGLTTVFGNGPVEQCTDNALRLLQSFGASHVPVARGCATPLFHAPLPFADFVHGKNGLGDVDLPSFNQSPVNHHAAEFIIKKAYEYEGELCICAIAPLSNLALALQWDPSIAYKIKKVVVMGGAIRVGGNVSPMAEANIMGDVHAADKVFTAPWPVTLVGLDVTHQVQLTPEFLTRLQDHGGASGKFLSQVSQFCLRFYQDTRKLAGLAAHDPTALAYLLDPQSFTVVRSGIRVLTEGIATGATLMADWPNTPVTEVCVDVNAERILALFEEHFILTAEHSVKV